MQNERRHVVDNLAIEWVQDKEETAEGRRSRRAVKAVIEKEGTAESGEQGGLKEREAREGEVREELYRGGGRRESGEERRHPSRRSEVGRMIGLAPPVKHFTHGGVRRCSGHSVGRWNSGGEGRVVMGALIHPRRHHQSYGG